MRCVPLLFSILATNGAVLHAVGTACTLLTESHTHYLQIRTLSDFFKNMFVCCAAVPNHESCYPPASQVPGVTYGVNVRAGSEAAYGAHRRLAEQHHAAGDRATQKERQQGPASSVVVSLNTRVSVFPKCFGMIIMRSDLWHPRMPDSFTVEWLGSC